MIWAAVRWEDKYIMVTDSPARATAPGQTVGVVVIVRDRLDHLARLLEGLRRQTLPPAEVAVVRMGGSSPMPLLAGSPTSWFVVDMDVPDGTPLPLASGRNLGARTLTTDAVIFLDVDCIPGAGLVDALGASAAVGGALASAQVQYLPEGVPSHATQWTEGGLRRAGTFHPARPRVLHDTDLRPELLWSLAIGLSMADFDHLDGFDDGYRGYGAEDTDLGFRADAAGMRLRMSRDARAYHQHHPTWDPPLAHVEDIVTNARRFHQRWGRWPMDGWLTGLTELGLVSWTPDAQEITLLRLPTGAELDQHRSD